MKRKMGLFLSIILVLSMFSQVNAQLNDINGHWGKESIIELVNKGIINGYEDSTFRPNRNIKRAEFVSIVNKALGLTDSVPVNFNDVTKEWQIDEIGKALKAGYIQGYGNGNFGPDNEISRQDAAIVVRKAFNIDPVHNTSNKFVDQADIRKDAACCVNALYEKGYINGFLDGSFGPKAFMRRAEAAIMLDRTIKAEQGGQGGKFEPSPGQNSDKPGEINKIEYIGNNKILISGTSNLSYTEKTFKSPERLVFDFKDFNLSHNGSYIRPSASKNIREIRFAQQAGFTRVTIELTGNYNHAVANKTNAIEITIDSPGTSTPPSNPGTGNPKALKIAIDTGHGLNTSGKEVPSYIGVGRIKEWSLNDRITREMIRLLNQYKNVEVIRLDDPTGIIDVSLNERARKANSWGADLLISNHHNAGINGGFGGGLVIYKHPNSTKFTRSMQQNLYNKIIAQTGLKGNRGSPLGEADFAILRQSNMASVLIEHGFMDSPSDMRVVMQSNFAPRSARGIINFLVEHYGLK